MGKEKATSTPRKEKVINSLHASFYKVLLGYAMHLTKDETDADEIISITFSKICQWKIDRLEKMIKNGEGYALRYLYVTMKNSHMDIIRQRARQKKMEAIYCERQQIKFEPSPEAKLISRERIKAINQKYYEAIALEKKSTRIAFYLKTKRGIRNKDIAKSLNQSPNTIATDIRRVRLKLKDII